jgi:hypothetical protein
MSGRTKPTRRRNATQKRDGIAVARMYNTRLTSAEIERIMAPCRQALAAFRAAVGSFEQWVVLNTVAHVATAIEDGGVIRRQRAIIEQADAALDAIGGRCGNAEHLWHPGACYAHELNALADLIAAHSRQVHELTYGEYTRATDKAIARVASDGGRVFRMEVSHAP